MEMRMNLKVDVRDQMNVQTDVKKRQLPETK